MIKKSFWHYPRNELTQKLLESIELGLVQSFTIFAPRRIGKTEFLEFDLKPELEKHNYKVIYFSFFSENEDLIRQFMNVLLQNVKLSVFSKLKEINLSWCKIDLSKDQSEYSILQLLTLLSIQSQKEGEEQLVLLLDEVQELQNIAQGKNFIAGLRTALDLNKEGIKVIFTGSSQDGLRRMFSERNAPFFHYGMTIQMDLFGREFTDFLADRFYERVKIKLNKDKLFEIFKRLNNVTEYIRHVISNMALEPDLNLESAYENYLNQLYSPEKVQNMWERLTAMEQAIIQWIRQGNTSFYDDEFKRFAISATKSNKAAISQGKIQYALDKLLRLQYISRNDKNVYEISDGLIPKFVTLK